MKARYEDAYSYVVVSTDVYFWRQTEVSAAMGFDRVLGQKNGMKKCNKNGWADDMEVFQKALACIPSDGRAFCAVIVPSNMHSDYKFDNYIKCDAVFNDVPDKGCQEYFRRAKYLDDQVSTFIKGLKEKGLYEETLIVVTSDHQVPFKYCSHEMKSRLSPYFPTMFINTDQDWTEHNVKNKDIVFCHSQLYPTMLQLMGLHPQKYAGLFPSMIDIDATKEYDFEKCSYDATKNEHLKQIYYLEEKMIRSGYFGKKGDKF